MKGTCSTKFPKHSHTLFPHQSSNEKLYRLVFTTNVIHDGWLSADLTFTEQIPFAQSRIKRNRIFALAKTATESRGKQLHGNVPVGTASNPRHTARACLSICPSHWQAVARWSDYIIRTSILAKFMCSTALRLVFENRYLSELL